MRIFFLHILRVAAMSFSNVLCSELNNTVLVDIFGQDGKDFPCFLDINSEKDHENGFVEGRGFWTTNRHKSDMLVE